MAIPKGTKVRQIVPIIEGTVESYSVDQESGGVLLMVVWKDAEGNEHSKYFKEEEVTQIVEE